MLYPFTYEFKIGGVLVAPLSCTACIESAGEIAPGAAAAEWTVTEIRVDGITHSAQSGLVACDVLLPEGGSDLTAALHADVMLSLFRDKGHVASISALWGDHVARAQERGRAAFVPALAASDRPGAALAAFAARGGPRQPVRMESARLPGGQPKRQESQVLPFGSADRRP